MSRLLLASSVSVFLLCASVIAQEPDPNQTNHVAAASAAWNAQNWQAASASYKLVVQEQPKNGQAWHRLGYSLHAQGKLDEALQAHEQALAFPQFAATGAYNAACVHALKGNTDKAFEWLNKSLEVGMNNVAQFQGDSDLDSLRKDPRFAKIMEKLKENAGKPQLQVFAQTTERKRSRIAWFGNGNSAGQLAIEYGAVAWQDKFEKTVGSKSAEGQKWRLGANFWTSLDTSVPMTVGGVAVAPGYYYLTLEQRDGAFLLGLHDAAKVRKLKLDGFQAQQLTGGIEIPMQHSGDAEVADNLSIEVALTAGQDKGEWRIAFGPHLLKAAVQIDLNN